MVRPMNEREITLGTRCDACSDLATHCDSEMTDFPLLLCTVHAFEQAIKHGGTVRPGIPPNPLRVTPTKLSISAKDFPCI